MSSTASSSATAMTGPLAKPGTSAAARPASPGCLPMCPDAVFITANNDGNRSHSAARRPAKAKGL